MKALNVTLRRISLPCHATVHLTWFNAASDRVQVICQNKLKGESFQSSACLVVGDVQTGQAGIQTEAVQVEPDMQNELLVFLFFIGASPRTAA